MAASVYVGLAVTSHNNGALNTATFENVAVPGAVPAVQAEFTADTTNGTAPLTVTFNDISTGNIFNSGIR
ncbi:MAG: hypothetical protein R3F37_13445 [Candidatus Competibacteraceae bacterium]